MSLQFHSSLEEMEIWSAASDGFSFVISRASRNGPGLHVGAVFLSEDRAPAGPRGPGRS
jgi:hypothetical protein